MMEFHISRKARERYKFAESLFSYSGNVIFANMAGCREFAYRMNTVRDAERHPELAVHAGQLYAMGLIDEASHALMARYRQQYDPAVFTQALEWFSGVVGAEPLGRMLLTFVEEFPGLSVMRGELTARKWLSGETDGVSHWAVALEELLLLWTANRNEAFKPFEELFEEKSLAERTVYRQVTRQFGDYFATRPLIPVAGAKGVSLLELLRAPAMGAPGSLSEQLKLIRALWKPLLGTSLDKYLEVAEGILREEELAIWMQFNPPAVQAKEAAEAAARRRRETGTQQWPSVVSTAEVPVFGDPAHEYEKFSPDMAWMPTAVMMAKSTYVWLAQLSRQYGRAIHRLDEIPDEELATLAARGLNTLWLIGVWERSRASKTIKQLCGNTDAVASAYSLFDYTIADDLGGEAAYVNLRDRAFHHGIRLASDMVPNHMGIDSPWVVEHPDWFISRPDSPYPVYSFNGPDLSQDGRAEIKIEDHYFEETDAAVVFQRRDRASGETRYIYHGNDGTSFPWNDTAQLDYLNPAVREQVIQTILHVARLFPVIRFDAAMTLAKRHFHRLWFPGPGATGSIPSRAEFGMSQAEFNAAMPQEFWREVVDRVAAEVPGTLLLAEAFWLMEGYFVRTLGMHRVYNSAFMVMLRDEDNAKYRSVIKNTIEFDPDILKRYVNFMSNPDERTAIDQFGKGDKCFGVAAMMATLPGLPMFGHGQIEGFTEKYGMEYQRPRYEENADPWLVERHQREIAPLLKRRRLFAESDNFLLYDFFMDSGKVDENVFAYSNRSGKERALVVFNNRYAETRGTIDWSAAYADKSSSQLRQQKIGEGLGFGDQSKILACKDSLTGLEYLRRASDLTERGLRLELHAYQCHVFVDWQELTATSEQPWDRLCDQLKGHGVASLEDALVKLELQPAHDALRLLLEPGPVRGFADLAEHPRTLAGGANLEIEAERAAYFEDAWARCESFLREAQRAYTTLAGRELPANPGLLRAAYRARLRAAMRIPATEALFPAPWTAAARRMLPCPSPQVTATAMWGPVLGWCALELLAESFDAENPEPVALDLFDRLRLREPFAQAFAALGFEGEEAWRVAARVKVGLLTGAGVGKAEATEAAEMKGAGSGLSISEAEKEVAPEAAEKLNLGRSSNEGATSVGPHDTENKEWALAPEGLAPALWLDPDLRWLTGVHTAEGHEFLVRERYEELLWWLQMPALLRLAGEAAPGNMKAQRTAARAMSEGITAALKTAEEAGYRVDLLLSPAAEATENPLPSEEKAAVEPEIVQPAEDASEPETASEPALYPGTTSQPAEKLTSESVLYQGTTSVVPQEPSMQDRALAPAESATSELPEEPKLPATFEAVPNSESAVELPLLQDEELEPNEPEITAAAESVVEAEAESLTASNEALTVEEEAPSPKEEKELAEPEIVEAAEAVLESEPEVGTAAKVEADAEPLPETVAEPEPEPEPEAEPEPEPVEPEGPAEAGATDEAAQQADAPLSRFDVLAKEAGEKLRSFARVEDESPSKAEEEIALEEFLQEFTLPPAEPIPSSVVASPAELSEETGEAAGDAEVEIEYVDEESEEDKSQLSIEKAELPDGGAESNSAESEEPEVRLSGAKGLVGSIASIFAHKPNETITLGLNEASVPLADAPAPAFVEDGDTLAGSVAAEEEPALTDQEESAPAEIFEPPAPEIKFSAGFGAEEEPKILAVVPVVSTPVEPFEPPVLEIEFMAMSPSEVAAERRRRIILPTASEWQTLDNPAQQNSASNPVQPPAPHRRKDDPAV